MAPAPDRTEERRAGRLRDGVPAVIAVLRRSTHAHPRAAAALALCLAGGLALRIVATASNWPTYTGFADSYPYAAFAGTDPFADPQHPAGYSLFLAAVGVVTRTVAAPVVLQNMIGVAGALVLGAAVWRVARTPWPAVAATAAVLLDSDEVFVEHTIMSESLFTAAIACALYAAVRALEPGPRAVRWAAAASAFAVLAALMRTAGLFLLPILALAVLLAPRVGPGGSDGSRNRRLWRRLDRTAAVLGTGLVLLLAYAGANAISHGRFETSPATGWHVYARAATFADCRRFTPPPGTQQLCEASSPAVRLGPDWYLYNANSPAVRAFGHLGNQDDLVWAWARAAILAEPGVWLRRTFHEIKGYFVPSTYPYVLGYGCGIDCQVDWNLILHSDPAINAGTKAGMQQFFAPFTVSNDAGGLAFLHGYENPFRFGATLLDLTALLTVLGLAIGPARVRLTILVFGGGSLTTLVLSTFGVYYLGRYTIPMAGPMIAAAGLCIESVVALERARRRIAAVPA